MAFTNLPATEVIADEMDKFTHPGATEVETVKEDTSKKARAG